MAWRFRLGLRREEHGGGAVQIAEAVPEQVAQEAVPEPVVSELVGEDQVTELAADISSASASPTEALAEQVVATEIAGRLQISQVEQEAAAEKPKDNPEDEVKEIPADDIAAAIDALTTPEPTEATEARPEPAVVAE